MNDSLPGWAKRVVELRRKLGLKQVEFAEKFGVTQPAVSRWETGEMEPALENYIRMGNIADEPDCYWFWQKAGVDVERIRKLLTSTS